MSTGGGGVNRDVTFTLKVRPDAGAQQAIDAFRSKLEQATRGTIFDPDPRAYARSNQVFTEALQQRSAELLKHNQRQQQQEQQQHAESVRRESSLTTMRRSNLRRIMADLQGITRGATQVTRGMVALGLVGERDLAKVTDTILRMQSAFDLINGSIRLTIGLMTTLGTLRGLGGLAGGASGGAGGGGGGGFGGAIGTAADLATIALLGRRGRGGAAAGRLFQGGARAAGGRIMAGAAQFGGRAAGLGGRVAMGAGRLATGPVGLAVAGAEAVQFARGQEGPTAAVTGLIRDLGTLRESSAALTRAEERRQQIVEAVLQLEQDRAELMRAERQMLGELLSMSERKMDAEMRMMTPMQQRVRLIEEEQQVQQLLGAARVQLAREEAGNTINQEAARQRVQQLEDQQVRLAERRLSLQQSMVRERERETQEARRALDTIESQITAEQERTMSLRERFGLMSDEQQAQLRYISARAAAGEQLSVEELRQLQGLGLEGADALVSQQAQARADAAGFGQLEAQFGGPERARMAGLQQARDEAQVRLATAIEVQVEFEEDTQALAQQIVGQIIDQTDERMTQLAGSVRDLYRQQQELARRQEQLRLGQLVGQGSR